MSMGFTKPIEHANLITKEGDFMNPLYVGIDVSSKSNVVYFMPVSYTHLDVYKRQV